MATIPVSYGENYFGVGDAGTEINVLYWSAVFSRILCDVIGEIQGYEQLHEQFSWNPASMISLMETVDRFVWYVDAHLWPCSFPVEDTDACIEILRSVPTSPCGYEYWNDDPDDCHGAMKALLCLIEHDDRYVGNEKRRTKNNEWLEIDFGLSDVVSLFEIVPILRSLIDGNSPNDSIGDVVPFAFTWLDMSRFLDAFLLETGTFFADATWETLQYEELPWDTDQVRYLIDLKHEAAPFMLAFDKFLFLSQYSAKFNEAVAELIQDALDWYALEQEFAQNDAAELEAELDEE